MYFHVYNECFIVAWSKEEAEKKGPSLVYWFQQSMESGDTSDEDTPPCDPKSNNLTQKEQSKAISMVVDMETDDGLKRHAAMVITKKIRLACADLLYYKSKNILLLLCTPMVLIYNSELGIIISSEFFLCKETPEEVLFTP